MRRPTAACLLALAAALAAGRAGAYIERLYSLKEILNESTNVLVAVVESVDREKMRATLRVVEDLKGVSGWKKININFAVGQFDHPSLMMKRLAPRLPALMFYQKQGGNFAAETHVFGSWFQTHAADGPDRDNVWWNFTHIEIHLQRTYAGPTPRLIQTVRDVLAGRAEPPAPNPMQASGPGPELPAAIPAAELYRAPGQPAPAIAGAAKSDSPAPARPALPSAAGPVLAGELFNREISLGSLGGPVMGVSWVDYDLDGDADVYACSPGANRLFRNDGGDTFTDVTAQVGLSGGSNAAAWADYNGDGRPDVVLSSRRLFLNAGGRFLEDTAQLPPALTADMQAAAWVDADADGRPDLLVGRGSSGFALLLNTGGIPAFTDGARGLSVPRAAAGPAQGFLTVADFNGDGRADVLAALQQLMLFKAVTPAGLAGTLESGLAAKPDPSWPVGVAAGDLDNDGLADVFVPQRQGGRLYRSLGRGAFADVTERCADLLRAPGASRGACWFDANGDGCQDLYVAMEQGHGRLYLNDRLGVLHDRTAKTGMNRRGPGGGAAGVAAADFDGDGDQDLLTGSRSGRVLILVNDLQRRADQAYVHVRVEGHSGKPGTAVSLHSQAGRLLGHRQLAGADNYGSQSEPAAFFAARPGPYQLRVRLPDGTAFAVPLQVPAEGARVLLGVRAGKPSVTQTAGRPPQPPAPRS